MEKPVFAYKNGDVQSGNWSWAVGVKNNIRVRPICLATTNFYGANAAGHDCQDLAELFADAINRDIAIKKSLESRGGTEERTFIGFQISGADGYSVHGNDEDPFGYNSFTVLTPETAIALMPGLPNGFHLLPIYDGDVEDPELI